MLQRQHRQVKLLYGLSDVLLTVLAFEAAYHTRLALREFGRLFFIENTERALLIGFAAVAWVLTGLWMGIYERLDAESPRIILRDTLRQCLYGVVGLILFEFLLRLDLSRPFLGFFAIYTWVLLCLFRLTAAHLTGVVRRRFGAPYHLLIVGTGEKARRLGEELEQASGYGICVLGFMSPGPEAGQIQLSRSYPVFPVSGLRELLRHNVIDEIAFAVSSRDLAELEDVFLLCDEEGVRTRVSADFFPHVHSKVSLSHLGNTPLLTFSAGPNDEIRLLVKRVIDVALAVVGLIVLMPLMVLIALLIRLSSKGPAIFAQTRCGLNGRPFTFYKFRSMIANAEELKAGLAHLNERSTVFKIRKDPRITRFGWFLRKFSIDEWPQLWNVLRGDMSLVGPRPAVPDEVDRYEQWQRRRLRMRPGLTCLWALNGRDHVDFETWMRMDMEYIDNWSLELDWKILLLTIPRVLTGHGAS